MTGKPSPTRRKASAVPSWEEIDGVLYPTLTVERRVRGEVAVVAEFIWPPGRHPVVRTLWLTTDRLAPTDGVSSDDISQPLIMAMRAQADFELRKWAAANPDWDYPLPKMSLSPRGGRVRIPDEEKARFASDLSEA